MMIIHSSFRWIWCVNRTLVTRLTCIIVINLSMFLHIDLRYYLIFTLTTRIPCIIVNILDMFRQHKVIILMICTYFFWPVCIAHWPEEIQPSTSWFCACHPNWFHPNVPWKFVYSGLKKEFGCSFIIYKLIG